MSESICTIQPNAMYEKYRDKILSYQRTHYQANKAAQIARLMHKVSCEICGVIMYNAHMSSHRIKKHNIRKQVQRRSKSPPNDLVKQEP